MASDAPSGWHRMEDVRHSGKFYWVSLVLSAQSPGLRAQLISGKLSSQGCSDLVAPVTARLAPRLGELFPPWLGKEGNIVSAPTLVNAESQGIPTCYKVALGGTT